MSLNGLSSVGGSGGKPTDNGQGSKKGAQEFSLQQQTSNDQQSHATQANSAAIAGSHGSRLMKIVDKRRKNRKYAPRTMLIDGEIYEVYLLAIA